MKTIKNLTADELRKSILQLAIQGKLVKQDPNDEPASELVKRIYEEKNKLIAEGKIKKDKNKSYIFKGDDNCYYEKIGNNEPVKLEDLPFDIPDNWMWIRLKNLCKIIFSGKSPKYSKEKTNNIAIGQAANTGVKIDLSLAKYCTDEFVKDMPNYYYLQKNDILLNTLGHGTLGRSGMYELNNDDILTDGHLFVFRLFNEITSTILHKYFILNRTNIEKSSNGTTNQIFLSLSTVGDYLFPLAPLEEQQRIVDKINSFEPLLKKYDKVEKELSKLEKEFPEKLKKSILQYAIEGKLVKQDPNDEPASVLLERIKQEKERLIKEGKIKRDKNESYIYQGDDKNYYENLPMGWSVCMLNNLATYKKGPFGSSLTKDMFVPDSTPNKVKVYEQKNAIQHDATIGDYFISYEKYLDMKSFTVVPGDIIVSCAGTIGEIYKLPLNAPKGIINQALMKVTLFCEEITNYFEIIFYDTLHKLSEKSKGTAIKNIAPFEVLKPTIILLPPLNEQYRILYKIKLINEIITD